MIDIKARVESALDRWGRVGFGSLVQDRMEKTVSLLGEEAHRLCPRRTGELAASITWEVSEDGFTGWYGSNKPWRGENSVPYAVFMEKGFFHVGLRRKIGPFPPPLGYLRGALYNKQPEIERIWTGRPPRAELKAEVRY